MLRPVWQNLRIGSKSHRSCMTKGRVLGRLVGLVGLVGRPWWVRALLFNFGKVHLV